MGTLPTDSFLRNALDLVFQDYPYLQPIWEQVYALIKGFVLGIKHYDVEQFKDIVIPSVSDTFDRVSGTRDAIADNKNYITRRNSESNLTDIVDKTLDNTRQTDKDDTFFSTAGPIVPPVHKEKNLLYRVNSCPDLDKGLTHKAHQLRYPLALDCSDNTPPPSEASTDSESVSPRASTPVKDKPQPLDHKKLHEIIFHLGGLQVPPVDIIAAPGQPVNSNLQRAQNRLRNMAQPNRRNPLRGADPALIEILERMEEREANHDNARKKFIMFPKDTFNGKTKGLAKSHWLEFKKYIDYQNQQGFLNPNDPLRFPEVKQIFCLTLNDNALGWYDSEHAQWCTLEHMKQAFLKCFNVWGDTRRQQQDSWNKLRFNMSTDDVDTFVTDMRTLASILGHNKEVIAEKFKDVFPDKNIEAALIAMDDFNEMQAKAKQLVQIYKPQQETDSALGACLMHRHEEAGKSKQSKKAKAKESNQHQLAPTQPQNRGQSEPQRYDNNYNPHQNDNNRFQRGRQDKGGEQGYYRENTFRRGRGRGRDGNRGHNRRDWDNSSQQRQAQNYPLPNRGRGGGNNSTRGRGGRYDQPNSPPQNPNTAYSQYPPQYNNYSLPQVPQPPMPPPHLLPPPPSYDPNWQLCQTQFYNSPAATGQYPCNPQAQNDRQKHRQFQQSTHVCELCGNHGHYDYQCQFAGDFMNHTRKAFQRSYYMHESDGHEMSQEDDQAKNEEQPFQ